MSNKPIISLFGSAIRTDLWLRLYASLMNNLVPFELVLVGDHKPDFELPHNLRFIYSPVKPAQCFEIGARYSLGGLIIPIEDAFIFSDGALDSLYKQFTSLINDKTIVSCRYFLSGNDCTGNCHYFWGQPSSPIAPVCPLIKKDLWMKLGGADRRFITSYFDVDMAMRIYEIGIEAIINKDAYVEEVHKPTKLQARRLVEEYGFHFDRPLLDSFWVKDGKTVKTRLSPVQPFADDGILTISQGAKARWL